MAEFVFEKQPEFVERDGKFVLDIPDGVPASELTAVKTSLTDFQTKYETANQKLSGFGDFTPDKVKEMQMQLAAFSKDGKPEEFKLKLAQFEQENKSYQTKIAELTEQNQKLTAKEQKTKINEDIFETATKKKIPEEFKAVLKTWANCFTVSDGKSISNGKGGFPAGLTVEQFIDQALNGQYAFMQPGSNGGGSKSISGGKSKKDEAPGTYKALMEDIWNKK